MNILIAIEKLKKIAERNPDIELAILTPDGFEELERIEERQEDGDEFVLLY